MTVVGIDFGYQTCFIAVARQGGIETVANEYSDRCTPAYVSLGEKQRCMGASAKNQQISNFKNTVSGWKKLIGRKFTDKQVQNEKTILPYEVVEQPNGHTGIKVWYMGEQQDFSPEQISCMMFTKLKDTASIALKTKVVDCVISVPCYFTDTERRAVMDSANMSGLNVLRLLNDTTATALAYGIYKQDLPASEEKARNVVFLDLGHSDLQLAACAFNKGKLKVLATASDSNLGGRDIDRLLANHFTEEFKTKYKVDANTKPRAYQRLLTECEKLKKLMSANVTEIPVNIECFIDDKDVSGRLNRAAMETMAADLFNRAEETMQAVLDFAKLKPDEVHSVEIVGGCSRIPMIKQLAKQVFGLEPSTTLNADESVARGCALQCAILSPTFRVRDFSIVDAQAYPITLTWKGTSPDDTGCLEVFDRFHQLPFSKMLTFYRESAFTLSAQYSCPKDIPFPETHIGSFNIENVAPQPNGESSKVKVKVRVNINGIFLVSSANMYEKLEGVEEETKEESMEIENGPVAAPAENGEQKIEADQTQEDEQKPAETSAPEAEPPAGEPPAGEAPAGEPMQTDNEQPADTASKDKKDEAEKKEGSAKKKKTVKTIELPIVPQVPQLNPVELNNLMEKEGQMAAQDKLEKERADAKNGVEEYVYEMRDKVSNELEVFVTENDRSTLQLKLEDVENWLYDEGEDLNKQAYIDKLTDLKKLGQPIVDRYREAMQRPATFEELGKALQLIKKALDLFKAKDEKYAHLEEADMQKVEKALVEAENWFEQSIQSCNSRSLTEPPQVTVSQIKLKKETLNSICNPILSKPKPKPKAEPPKDEKKEEKKDSESGKQGEGDGTAKTESAAAEEDGTKPPAASPADMELD